MGEWVNSETGEVVEGDCPRCANVIEHAEAQLRAMEMELRQKRAKITRLERQADRETVAKRDGAVWKDVLAYWLEAFPDKRPSAKGIKSARATKVFMRLESGANVEDVKLSIDGARLYPYVVFGKRQKSGSKSDLADDLEQIMAINRDHEFDFLRDAGRAARDA